MRSVKAKKEGNSEEVTPTRQAMLKETDDTYGGDVEEATPRRPDL